MLRVAICDDDSGALTALSGLLEQYQQTNNLVMVIEAFHSAADLLPSLSSRGYDFVMMDILMPGLSGMQAAREIRSYDNQMPLLFLTSSPYFAVESYSVEAFSYLLKPITAESLFPVLDRLLKKLRRNEEYLILTRNSDIMRLPFSNIEFVEVNRKHLWFYMEDGSMQELPGTLAEYEPQFLCRKAFMKVHRSFIANLSHVQLLDARGALTYSGRVIPVARALALQVRQKYAEYLFEGDV